MQDNELKSTIKSTGKKNSKETQNEDDIQQIQEQFDVMTDEYLINQINQILQDFFKIDTEVIRLQYAKELNNIQAIQYKKEEVQMMLIFWKIYNNLVSGSPNFKKQQFYKQFTYQSFPTIDIKNTNSIQLIKHNLFKKINLILVKSGIIKEQQNIDDFQDNDLIVRQQNYSIFVQALKNITENDCLSNSCSFEDFYQTLIYGNKKQLTNSLFTQLNHIYSLKQIQNLIYYTIEMNPSLQVGFTIKNDNTFLQNQHHFSINQKQQFEELFQRGVLNFLKCKVQGEQATKQILIHHYGLFSKQQKTDLFCKISQNMGITTKVAYDHFINTYKKQMYNTIQDADRKQIQIITKQYFSKNMSKKSTNHEIMQQLQNKNFYYKDIQQIINKQWRKLE